MSVVELVDIEFAVVTLSIPGQLHLQDSFTEPSAKPPFHHMQQKRDVTLSRLTPGVQYFLQPDAVRAGVSEAIPKPTEEYKKLNDERRERAQEVLVRNNSWMKDMSRDDVDAKKAAFKKDLEQPRKVTDDYDVDMEGVDA